MLIAGDYTCLTNIVPPIKRKKLALLALSSCANDEGTSAVDVLQEWVSQTEDKTSLVVDDIKFTQEFFIEKANKDPDEKIKLMLSILDKNLPEQFLHGKNPREELLSFLHDNMKELNTRSITAARK